MYVPVGREKTRALAFPPATTPSIRHVYVSGSPSGSEATTENEPFSSAPRGTGSTSGELEMIRGARFLTVSGFVVRFRSPSPSSTVRATTKTPFRVYAWVAVLPDPVLPSPKSHDHDVTPMSSVEAEPSNVTKVPM